MDDALCRGARGGRRPTPAEGLITSPLSILAVVSALRDPDSGTVGHILGLGRGLQALGHRVEHVFLEDLSRPLSRVHPILSLLTDVPVSIARTVLRRVHDAGGYDVIELWDQGGLFVAAARRVRAKALGDACVLVNRSAGVAGRVWEEHLQYRDIYPASRKTRVWHPLYIAQERLACRWADAVVVRAGADVGYVTSKFGIPRARIFQGPPPGVEPENLAEPSGDRPLDVLFVGTWISRKGIRYLVGALREMARRRPNLTVTLAGVGLGNASRVQQALPFLRASQLAILEKVPRRELFKQYKMHKLLLFPSLSEGFGMVVLEAMAAGMVVVCSSIPGAPELIRDGVNGFLVPARDARALAERALVSLQDQEACTEVARRAIETAQRYTWERVAREMVRVYASAMASR